MERDKVTEGWEREFREMMGDTGLCADFFRVYSGSVSVYLTGFPRGDDDTSYDVDVSEEFMPALIDIIRVAYNTGRWDAEHGYAEHIAPRPED